MAGRSGRHPQGLPAPQHEVDALLVVPAKVLADVSHQRPDLVDIWLDVTIALRAVERREWPGAAKTVVVTK